MGRYMYASFKLAGPDHISSTDMTAQISVEATNPNATHQASCIHMSVAR